MNFPHPTTFGKPRGRTEIRRRVVRCMLIMVPLLLPACQPSDVSEMVGTLERNRIELKVESNEPIIAIHVQEGQEVWDLSHAWLSRGRFRLTTTSRREWKSEPASSRNGARRPIPYRG